MKLLLDNNEIEDLQVLDYRAAEKVAQAQLKHILNLDMKTTSELIVTLEARLDELYQKEVRNESRS